MQKVHFWKKWKIYKFIKIILESRKSKMGRGRASTVTTPFDLEKYFRKDREQKIILKIILEK